MSAVSEELYDEICREYRPEVPAQESSLDFRQQLKEKQVLEEMRRSKARQELEERLKFAGQIPEERPTRLQQVRSKQSKILDEQLVNKRKKAKPEVPKAEPIVEQQPVDAVDTDSQSAEEFSVVEMISKAKRQIDEQKKVDDHHSRTDEAKPKKMVAKDDAPDAIAAKEEPADVAAAPSKDKKPEKAKTEIPDAAKAAEKASVEAKPAAKPAGDQQKASTAESDKSKRKGKGRRKKKRKISNEEIEASIRQTLASMDEVKGKRRKRRVKDSDEVEVDEELGILQVSEFITVSELADRMEIGAGDVITKCLELGLMVSINQRLDMDTIEAVADEFGFEVERIEEYGSEIMDRYEETEEDLKVAVKRSPVVTIMGHVDHGKTSLLDYIRKSSIISGEAGGITQHIGAYSVTVAGKDITFLDTPGHEAFTAMRARGAQATDLVVLIVAADDGVQPQTLEAINHSLAAQVPIVVAINKIDKPSANPDMIKKQLSEHDVLVEEWGGKYQAVEVSAKMGQGVDRLMELILLEAELLELKANPARTARGVIIESRLDKGKGAVGTVLVQTGTLKVGDIFIAGQHSGKVRAMYDERNKAAKDAPPSSPIQVIGFDGVPQAGDSFVVMDSEREVRELSAKRQQLKREQDSRSKKHITLDQISQQIKEGQVKELNIILKADVDGSNEALSDALLKLSNKEVAVKVIHKAVGGISESDILLASASNAVIIGFHVRPSVQARDLAKKEEIDVRIYDIIYSAVDDVKSALEGMLDPEITDELTATIEVREIFKVPKVGTIAGSYVLSGKATRTDLIKLYRDDKLLHETRIGSLKRFKEDVREVASGFECGVSLVGFDDLKIGDVIETYKKVETARTLEG